MPCTFHVASSSLAISSISFGFVFRFTLLLFTFSNFFSPPKTSFQRRCCRIVIYDPISIHRIVLLPFVFFSRHFDLISSSWLSVKVHFICSAFAFNPNRAFSRHKWFVLNFLNSFVVFFFVVSFRFHRLTFLFASPSCNFTRKLHFPLTFCENFSFF